MDQPLRWLRRVGRAGNELRLKRTTPCHVEACWRWMRQRLLGRAMALPRAEGDGKGSAVLRASSADLKGSADAD